MRLNELHINDKARIKTVGGEGALRQHLLDMGMIPGAELCVVKFAPMGDPMELKIHGYELTLRLDDAKHIEITPLPAQTVQEEAGDQSSPKTRRDRDAKQPGSGSGEDPVQTPKVHHPGLGEGGRFHMKDDGDPLPDDTLLTFALVGNQNSGKTTLFNTLTGSNQHVGNFPGVTVEGKDGPIRNKPNTSVTDLPGIYSMSPYSTEEIVSRDFVIKNKPTGIINIVDATNIERNLYLTMQLLEMNIPMVVALNMMDEVRENGGTIDINGMENMLGVPVIPISAANNEGVDELVSHALHVAHFRERPLRQDFCDEHDHGGAVHRCLHAVSHLIEDHATRASLPIRFAASKVVEGDERVIEALALDDNEKEMLEHIVVQMEKERELDKCAAIADMRFAFINRVCDACVRKPKESKERTRSEKIDRILTGKFTAIPALIIIMGAVFFLTFNVVGAFLQWLLELGIGALSDITDRTLTSAGASEVLHGLIIDGIFAGVGSVLSFMPIIVIMFFFLSLLEDSGYIARVAFVMDKLLRRIGLSGRSMVPMLIGFGCTVPAVMATRTLPSERDRRMTILLTPFMSCSAKMPIYAFFVAAFFPRFKALIMIGLYVLGMAVGVIIAFFYRKTLFKGEAVPFVMELPNYRMPRARNVLHLLWEKAKDFLQRAFSVILIATIVIWVLKSFNTHFAFVTDSKDSMLAAISGWIAPLMRPAGLGDWRLCTALISGFMAKESVVSTLQVLFSEQIADVITPLTAVSLLVFSLLYTPCVAAVAAVRRELGRRWAVCMVIWQCMVAWIAAAVVQLLGRL